jgi:hypothetical protein
VGGHDDVGDIAFDAQAEQVACPVLFSSDGGVYFNTITGSQECHTPAWEQPLITPHALWLWALAGADQPGDEDEFLYFGNQDNGTFATVAAGAASPNWNNRQCCDGFDDSSDPGRVLYTVCCSAGPQANRLFLRNPGMVGGGEINTYPPGNLPGFRPIDVIDQFGADEYVVVTTAGVFVSTQIDATPIVWTQLGAATTPPGACGVEAATAGGSPTFYVQAGSCDGRSADELWVFTGINPAGAWQQIMAPSGGFGIYAVNPTNPMQLYASNLQPAGPQMIRSNDGGATWANDAQLDNLMTGGGVFRYENQRGPTAFTGFGGYPQPTLIAFNPLDPDILVAGGADSGLFVSTNGGSSWTLVTDPFDSGNSGVAHIPRPQFAYFDHEPTSDFVNVYIGTRGRGVWRIAFQPPQPRFEYAAKIVCGVQDDPANTRLVRGFYGTAINILNPNPEPASFSKILSLTFPPDEQAPGEVIPISEDNLGPDQALEVDCIDIERRLFPNGLPTSYIKGFVIIRSTHRLDVVGVYTTGALGKGACCDETVITHSSIDVEHIPERQIEQPPQERDLPDLIPVAPFPPPPTGAPGTLPQNFCMQPDVGPRAEAIRILVRNQGAGPAGATDTRVEFFPAGSDVPVATLVQPTPALGANGETPLEFDIPDRCYVGESGCNFTITVDAMEEVNETNEGNNTVESFCPGVVS